jgi:hypothetical protein
VRKKYFALGRLEQPMQDKNLLYWHKKPNKRTKEASLSKLSFVLFEFPFVVSFNSQQGPPLFVSLVIPPSFTFPLHCFSLFHLSSLASSSFVSLNNSIFLSP